MKKKLIFVVLASMLLNSSLVFAQESDPMNANERALNDRLINLTGQIQSINQELSTQRASIGKMSAELSAQADDEAEFKRDMLKELKALRRQNQSLIDSFADISALRGSDSNKEIKPLRNYDLQTPDGKMYFGEDEYVYIKEADATIDARIDTGAAVSSISASDIAEFERQGKKWYRFTIDANDHNITVEAPFVRTSIIRQSSKETTTERVVVSLTVKVGEYSTQSEFTLTDRSRMQYPLLIGRSLIQDIAVVDVSRDHIQGRNVDTFLILNRNDYEANVKKGIDLNKEFKAKQAKDATGQVAYPSQDYGANLGTNSENALPVVRNAKSEESVNKEEAKVQKATPLKGKDTKLAAAESTEAKPDEQAQTSDDNKEAQDNQDQADTKESPDAAQSKQSNDKPADKAATNNQDKASKDADKKADNKTVDNKEASAEDKAAKNEELAYDQEAESNAKQEPAKKVETSNILEANSTTQIASNTEVEEVSSLIDLSKLKAPKKASVEQVVEPEDATVAQRENELAESK